MARIEMRPGVWRDSAGQAMREAMLQTIRADRERLRGASGYTPELLAEVQYEPEGAGKHDIWESPETVRRRKRADCDGRVRLGAVVYPHARIGFTGDGVREHTFLVLPTSDGPRILDYSGVQELASPRLGALSPTVLKWLRRSLRDMRALADAGIIPAPYAAPWFIAAMARRGVR